MDAKPSAPAVTAQSLIQSATGLEMVLIVAPPACGKSRLARQFQQAGYVRINRDTLGTQEKCIKAAKEALQSRQPDVRGIVIDNTNTEAAVRHTWISIAKDAGIPVSHW